MPEVTVSGITPGHGPAHASAGAAGLLPGCNPDCHGCRHRHLDREASLAAKGAFLARTLADWQDRLSPVRSVPDGERLGYRDRVTLTARHDGAKWQFGLVRRDELVPIPDCPVHTARVRRLVHLLEDAVPPPDRFPLGWLHVAGAQATLVVKARSPEADWIAGLGPALVAAGIEGLWLNCNPSAGRKLFLKTGWRLAWGEPRSRDTGGLLHGPGAFQQLLPGLHREALDAGAEFLFAAGVVPVLDLYCGNGASLVRWRQQGAACLGVESAGDAAECAHLNAPGAEVFRGSCRTRLPQVRDWWRQQGEPRPAAWVNPDRSGLEPEVCAALAEELQPDRLAYLSCSAGSLARDLRHLGAAGYQVHGLVPFDFFPRTHHVEVLALLRQSRRR
jgi:23S rRNA (uracil1939-C5)-methyltransferase